MEGVRLAGPNPTREGFLNALLEAESIDLGGFLPPAYGPADNQGSDRVYLTIIDQRGRVRPVRRMTRP